MNAFRLLQSYVMLNSIPSHIKWCLARQIANNDKACDAGSKTHRFLLVKKEPQKPHYLQFRQFCDFGDMVNVTEKPSFRPGAIHHQ